MHGDVKLAVTWSILSGAQAENPKDDTDFSGLLCCIPNPAENQWCSVPKSGRQLSQLGERQCFVQGFVPAIIAREILIRKQVVSGRRWLAFIVVSVCLAISAFYELIEWWVAIMSGESAEAFLGTQGYIWDTQSDMMYALTGAIVALLLLSKTHDRQIMNVARGE